MIASIIATINLLLAFAELSLTPGSDAPLLAVVLAAAVVVTVAVVLLVVPGLVASAPRPSPRPIDPSALVAQSDPDAAGHPRPRAPGLAIPVA
ncbi:MULTISPECIES: DUF6412 domain-containing protein [Microbacterium]|uniref:DUF6412 domain-containing protein n=1 Tax=Microbacterium TaxID=33882 RepID=UPI0011A86080|nr:MULTISPECIES: DUF6412 domain-containing protein [Microbacterium]MCD2169586.1 DUF6412 domain-containing protein [Microbacterium sp. JC 701]MCM3500320.1 DUF6412 domain-containing protein [Microbacterium sp. P26]MDQ1173538.1 hypothetical protein [Microbacterium testaceum]